MVASFFCSKKNFHNKIAENVGVFAAVKYELNKILVIVYMLSFTGKFAVQRLILILLALVVLSSSPSFAAPTLDSNYLAIVNNEVISADRYYEEFRKGVRETFYHGKVTEKELDNFRDKVVKKLVNEVLLLQQAKELGIKPDPQKVAKDVEVETAKYRQQKNWESGKEGIVSSVKAKIEIENILDQLEKHTRGIAKPSLDAVKKYYDTHADKFTAPEKWNVSIIMLKVDPSSPSTVWQEAAELADNIVKKIRDGENFEELARIHSGDESAVDGGNMGYVHTGMLSKPAQNVLNTMDIGQVSEPVMLLQGVAIFRLNGVQGSRLNSFETVKDRAEDLLMREMQDKAWENLVITLRKKADIKINKQVVKNATTGPRPQS